MSPCRYYTRFVLGVITLLLLGLEFSGARAQVVEFPSDASPGQKVIIHMESYVFLPSEITIDAGQDITFIFHNDSFLVPHNFLLDDPQGVRILDVDISSGESQSFSLTLTEPGMYPFYCEKQLLFFPSHREEGMEGRLIVQ